MSSVLHFILLVCSSLFLTTAFAYFESPNNTFKAKSEMNSIKFESYRGFPQKWKLVTVRYRKDSSELRLTYANDLAYRHLTQANGKPYPEGAVFGKVSFKTESDPVFTSSEVPTQSRRYQLMVRDSKRFKEQDGWGYALFDSDGLTFDEDPKLKVQSCHACHQIVKDAHFVFSELAPFAVGSIWKKSSRAGTGISWDTLSIKDLPPGVGDLLRPEKLEEAVVIKGPITKYYFSGTLDEIVPTLIEKSHSSKKAAAFIGDESNFSIVIPTKTSCFVIHVLFKRRIVRNERKCNLT